MKLRPIEAAENAAESVEQAARGKLLDWLHHEYCDECGAVMDADTKYVESQAMPMPVYECRECDHRVFRDEDNPVTADMWD